MVQAERYTNGRYSYAAPIVMATMILVIAVPIPAQAAEFKVRIHFRGLVDLVAERDATAEELFVLLPETRFGKFSDEMTAHSPRIYYHMDNGAGGIQAPNCFEVGGDPTEWRFRDISNLHIEPLTSTSPSLNLDRRSIGNGRDPLVSQGSLEWLADIDKQVLDWPTNEPHSVLDELFAASYSPVGAAMIISRFRFSRGSAYAGELFRDTDDNVCLITFGREERHFAKEFILELAFNDEARLVFRNLFSAQSYYVFTLTPSGSQSDFDVYVEHTQPCYGQVATHDFIGHYKIRMSPERGNLPSECKENPPPTDNPQCSPAQNDYP